MLARDFAPNRSLATTAATKRAVVFAAATLAVVAAGSAEAQTKNFIAADANFTDPTAFDPAGVPGGTNRVLVNNGGVLRIDSAGLSSFGIDAGTVANATGTVAIGTGADILLNDSLRLGLTNGAVGTGIITGGTVNIVGNNEDLAVGDNLTGTGTGAAGFLTIGGTATINVADNVLVGARGSVGTATQTAGALNIGDRIVVGGTNGGVGSYALSGGSVTLSRVADGLGTFFVAPDPGSQGTVTQTGGTVVAAALLRVGANNTTAARPATGVYSISSADAPATLRADGNVLIGTNTVDGTGAVSGTGTFVVNGPGSTIDFNAAMAVGANGTVRFEITDGGISLVDVAGAVQFNPAATLQVEAVGFTPTFGTTYDLVTATAFTGFSAGPLPLVDDQFAFSLVPGGNGLTLQATVVPEPAAMGLVGLLGATLLRRRR